MAKMKLGSLLGAVLLALAVCLSSHQGTSDALVIKRQGSGERTVGPLTWNADYFSIEGQPINIIAAEIHHFRTPVPALLRDPLEKIKAAGFNAISVYTHWGMVMPSADPASVSLDAAANQIASFFQLAKEVGLFVIYRPGPYINSEANGGGMPGWVQNLDCALRADSACWDAAWQPYMKAVIDAAAPFQAKLTNGKLDTSGGTVFMLNVENEFQDADLPNGQSRVAYFDKIIDFYHNNGITVPTLHNALQGTSFHAADTKLDIWGADSYPNGFDCTDPLTWDPAPEYYNTYNSIRPSNPRSIPEYQGGAFFYYGGVDLGSCNLQLNQSMTKVYHKDAAGQEVRFTNQYMTFGGTSFGNIAYFPFEGTSYDYAGGLDEMRQKRDRLMEDKLLHNFMQSFPEWASMSIITRGRNVGATEQNHDTFISSSRSTVPNVNTKWYITRQDDVTSNAITTFKLTIDSASGQLTIPRNGNMRLEGRDSAIVPVDKALAASGATLTYSTAEVSFLGQIDGRDVIVAQGNANQGYEIQIQGAGAAAGYVENNGQVSTSSPAPDTLVVNWTPPNYSKSVQVVTLANGKQVLLLLTDTAFAYFNQVFSTAAPGTLEHIASIGDRVMVSGAYHIGNAKINGASLDMTGQTNVTSFLEAVVPASVTAMTFNGVQIGVNRTPYGTLTGSIQGPSGEALAWNPPAISGWKKADSLPEIQPGFVQDGNWKKADLTSTPNPFFGQTSTKGVVLFADAYGFHSSGNIIWQGRFTPDGGNLPTSLDITVQGGQYFQSSIYLNNVFLGKLEGDGSADRRSGTLNFPGGSVTTGENVITVLTEDMGHMEVGGVDANPNGLPFEQTKNPRGILSYNLNGAQPAVAWTVTGKQGGETVIDKVRGALNEGGLYGERMGWHLPGFDDSQWAAGDPFAGDNAPGVSFYRTSFDLNMPADHDMPLAFDLGGLPSTDDSQDYIALLFVNGWQYGRRVAKWGPQTEFPVPPGILDPRGHNEIAVALWGVGQGAKLPKLELKVKGRYWGDVPYQVNNPTYQQVRG